MPVPPLMPKACWQLSGSRVRFVLDDHYWVKSLLMTPPDPSSLTGFARKYIWWMTPDIAVTMPERVVAQVMNIGDYDDVQALVTLVGDDYLRAVLRRAEVGQFTSRSWAYWHYRLGLAVPGHVPAMPTRTFA